MTGVKSVDFGQLSKVDQFLALSSSKAIAMSESANRSAVFCRSFFCDKEPDLGSDLIRAGRELALEKDLSSTEQGKVVARVKKLELMFSPEGIRLRQAKERMEFYKRALATPPSIDQVEAVMGRRLQCGIISEDPIAFYEKGAKKLETINNNAYESAKEEYEAALVDFRAAKKAARSA